MGGAAKRHLSALLWKNFLLKRRHPCSCLCEFFLAIASIGLLAVARYLTSGIKAREIAAKHHIENTLPVYLPECADYVADCSVEIVRDQPYSPVCVKGMTFGCVANAHHSGKPGVWASMGCNGTFEVELHGMLQGKHQVSCSAGGPRSRTCPVVSYACSRIPHGERKDCGIGLSPQECGNRGCCWQGPGKNGPWCYWSDASSSHQTKEPHVGGPDLKESSSSPSMLMQSLLGGGVEKAGMRRLDAVFAIAPADGGGRKFRDWLETSGHPWASHVKLFDSASEVQAHMRMRGYPQRNISSNKSSLLCGAVIFETPPDSPEVKYTLRFNRSLSYDPNLPPLIAMMRQTKIKTQGLVETVEQSTPMMIDTSGITWYTQSGFLALQRSVDTFIQDTTGGRQLRAFGNGESSMISLGEDGRPHVVVPFPTPGWVVDIFAIALPNLLPKLLLVSMAYSVNKMITGVVHEREARLRDGMRMMGMHPASFYASWMLTYVAIYLFVVAGVAALLVGGGILPRSSPSLICLFLFLASLATISYGLVISTFFSKAKTAATVGSIAFFSSSYLGNLANAASPRSTLLLLSLLPPVNFEMITKIYASLESQQVGISWSNASLAYHGFSVADGCVMLAVDALMLFVFFLYLDQVMPRDIGLQRKWYFPLLPSFWSELCCPSRLQQRDARTLVAAGSVVHAGHEAHSAGRSEASALIEREVGEAAAMMARSGQTVELRQLSKRYGSFWAVDSLDLVMYQGEIFSLLGHNGAGKTTTLTMLCGLISPTSGSCVFFGHDGFEDRAEAQRLLGVCPQHDVLWEELTSEEHLLLFATFKGVAAATASDEVANMLQRVGLQQAGAGQTQAGRLSGGMKRKLSLGIAFLGGSRLVVLDEPTSGLDPYSRRAVWELLRSMKQGRVTVLSTHYMDEADILGDRIAILHEGRLKCCGSPQFLKRAYDCGYNITFVKRTGCKTDAVREALCKHVPELASQVSLLSDSGKELILQFPFVAARHFPRVLGSLEHQLDELCVESYGISVTTLEEVFLKVASGDVPQLSRDAVAPETVEHSLNSEYIELGEMGGAEREPDLHLRSCAAERGQKQPLESLQELPPWGCRAAVRQTRALLVKRWRYGSRDRKAMLCQLLLPTGTLLLFLMLMSRKFFSSQPLLQLEVRNYNEHCDAGRGHARNMVDYTYLPSVYPWRAEAFLEPGKDVWQGDLRRNDPQPAGEIEETLEEAAFSALPELFRTAMREAAARKASHPEGARRLVAESASSEDLLKLVEGRLLAVAKRFLPSVVQLQTLGSFFDQEVQLSDKWQQGRHLAAKGKGKNFSVQGLDSNRAHSPFGPRLSSKMDPMRFCFGSTDMERFAWGALDHDHDGFVTKQDIGQLLHSFADPKQRKIVAAFLENDKVKEKLRELGLESILQGKSEEEADAAIMDLIETGLILALDRDGDGKISSQEFCSLGRSVREQAQRFYTLAHTFSQQILMGNSTCPRYGGYYVVAAGGSQDSPRSAGEADAIVFVNTSSTHAPAVFQAAMTNARLGWLGLDKKVSVSIHPFEQTEEEQIYLERYAVFLLTMCVTFCLSFIPSGIAQTIVKERSSGARQLQVLSGASHLSYWVANLSFDLLMYTLPALSIPVTLHYFGYHLLLDGRCGLALAAVVLAFGPAVAGFSYLLSFLFKDHSKASNSILTFCLIGAIVLSTVLFVLSAINYSPTAKYPSACDYPTEEFPEGNCAFPGARTADRILGPIFRLVPTVCVYQALFSIALVANLQAVIPEGAIDAMKSAVGAAAPNVSLDPFAFEWAGEPLMYLTIEGVAFFALALILDTAMHSPWLAGRLDAASCRRRFSTKRGAEGLTSEEARLSPLIDDEGSLGEGPGDESVWAEKQRTAMATKQDLALHVWGLEKIYRHWIAPRSVPKHAVRGISFAIHSGEVFGLLGHNGAGKTSAIKCFVGEQCCTAGSVHVGGFDMEQETSQARRRLGYCPQFDALLERLTVKDHLELYASIRGLGKEAVESTLSDFKLVKMARCHADVLSGGNKRKLSAAIALMGAPALAVLDEPSCGLDPAARRALWTAVHGAVAGAGGGFRLPSVGSTTGGGAGRTPSAVLLTTHSMEEAEALSNRLGILADGQLLTVGTAQQIKQRHGDSHELTVTMRGVPEDMLAATLQQFGGELTPSSLLNLQSLQLLVEADPWKRSAYHRPRCIVRMQIEQNGAVEAAVLAEWWLQQATGERIESFLQTLGAGDRVELAENFGLFWRFRLPRAGGLRLPMLFQKLEEQSEALGIAEYMLSQASLEQIFNSIAEGAEQSREEVATS
eukprot:TRINITY_DN21692_c0_g1_i1.p1 TRINITY_DN21692_c0_g1~~TRINITY_DN21692_c0_g1_i1.p1  ORF type:complete len:2300 (+),score=403.74 TRINITY_DN21692_c0_g1_i1:87-6986(+)